MGDRPGRVLALALASVATGLAEAAMLAFVAQAAMLIGTGAPAAGVDLGPIRFSASAEVVLLLAATMALTRLLLQLVVAWLPARIAADMQAVLQINLYEAFLQSSWATQAQDREGTLQELLGGHVVRAIYAILIVANGIAALFTLLTLLAAAIVLGPVIAGVVLVVASLLFLVFRPISRLVGHQGTQVSTGNVDLASEVSEAVRLSEETNVFGVANVRLSRLRDRAESIRQPFFRAQLVGRAVSGVYQSTALLVVIGGLAILNLLGGGQLATLGAVVLIVVRALAYGQQLQTADTNLAEYLPFWERIDETIQRYRASARSGGSLSLDGIRDLRLVNVEFGYNPAHPILTGVNLHIKEGEVLGVIGPSGAGKSTLMHLLLQLREPDAGEYLVNGQPAAVHRIEDWQRLVAYIPQDPKIITGSIADNIKFLRPIDDDLVVRAAKLAHIHEEILTRPGGYQAQVGPRANSMSGGQIQRICLARALAGQPKLILLDEPTSALDAKSEALLIRSLEELRGQVTVVLVAHREALLDLCDKVIRVSKQSPSAAAQVTHWDQRREASLDPHDIHPPARADRGGS